MIFRRDDDNKCMFAKTSNNPLVAVTRGDKCRVVLLLSLHLGLFVGLSYLQLPGACFSSNKSFYGSSSNSLIFRTIWIITRFYLVWRAVDCRRCPKTQNRSIIIIESIDIAINDLFEAHNNSSRTLPLQDWTSVARFSDDIFLEGWNLALRAASIIAPLRSAVNFHPSLFLELHPRPPPVQFKEERGMKIHLMPDLATLNWTACDQQRLSSFSSHAQNRVARYMTFWVKCCPQKGQISTVHKSHQSSCIWQRWCPNCRINRSV